MVSLKRTEMSCLQVISVVQLEEMNSCEAAKRKVLAISKQWVTNNINNKLMAAGKQILEKMINTCISC